MSTKTHLSQPVDIPILRHLWNWKVATTSGLHRKFFPTISGEAAYNRLYRMERAGYIQTQVDVTGRHHLWILTKKGFATIKGDLPPLKEEGFRSENPAHDLLVSTIHLGELLFGDPEGISLVTEQQLRRYKPEFYPPWVPKNSSHVPDGYWHLSKPSAHTIALEVELFQKGRVDYEKVARFYDNHPQISKILWIVRWESLSEPIQRSIYKGADEPTNV